MHVLLNNKLLCFSSIDLISIQQIQEEIYYFEEQFHQIKNATREILQQCGIAVEEVADTLTSLSPDGERIHRLFLHDKVNILFQSANHFALFGNMNSHWDYLNYPLLDHLVRRFRLEKVKGQMNAYKANLKQFRQMTPLSLFCQSQMTKCTHTPPDFQEVVVEFQWPESGEPVMLEKVEEFRRAYANHYHLREFAMMLNKVRPGSFIVTWLVPKCIVAKLKANVPEGILSMFFVVKLEIAGECIYPFSKTKVSIYLWLLASNNTAELIYTEPFCGSTGSCISIVKWIFQSSIT